MSYPTPAAAPVESLVISTVEQLDEVNQADGWSTVEYRQLEPGSLDARFDRREGGYGVHCLEEHSRRLEVHCSPPPGVLAAFAVEGGVATANGRTIGEGDFVLQLPGAELHGMVTPGLKVFTVLAPAALFPAEFLQATGVKVVRAGARATRAFRALHRSYVTAATDRGLPDDEAAAEILDRIAGVVMSNDRAAEGRHGRLRANRALARAREYMEAHLEEPIRISAVAAHAGVDTRTLERYFARGLGVSPKRYLLARRLNSARKRLVAADPERARVTDVAFEHGLTHLGRFPAQYRSYFGEHPRQTLQDR